MGFPSSGRGQGGAASGASWYSVGMGRRTGECSPPWRHRRWRSVTSYFHRSAVGGVQRVVCPASVNIVPSTGVVTTIADSINGSVLEDPARTSVLTLSLLIWVHGT
jgi:hypothetical protein